NRICVWSLSKTYLSGAALTVAGTQNSINPNSSFLSISAPEGGKKNLAHFVISEKRYYFPPSASVILTKSTTIRSSSPLGLASFSPFFPLNVSLARLRVKRRGKTNTPSDCNGIVRWTSPCAPPRMLGEAERSNAVLPANGLGSATEAQSMIFLSD